MDTNGTDRESLEPLLSVAELCALLGVSEQVLYRVLRRGELPSLMVGGRRMFEPADVRAYIDARKTKGLA